MRGWFFVRIVVQRVLEADVKIDDKVEAGIGKGLVALVGFSDGDDGNTIEYMLNKMVNLRIFEDSEEKLNLSVKDIDGGLLVVPNFTIYADARHGRRPSFTASASADNARKIFDLFKTQAKDLYENTYFGVFQADMKVTIVNDGPVTILLDSDKLF